MSEGVSIAGSGLCTIGRVARWMDRWMGIGIGGLDRELYV